MERYKEEFIEFMVESEVLKFGDFTLKSGRKSPFFMNAGAYVTGSSLKRLGEYYAKAIHERFGDDFDVLFGPAYKGIPLSVTTAIAYSELFGKQVRYSSNRKEIKDHGDKGILLGGPILDGDRVILIEDVNEVIKRIFNGHTYLVLFLFNVHILNITDPNITVDQHIFYELFEERIQWPAGFHTEIVQASCWYSFQSIDIILILHLYHGKSSDLNSSLLIPFIGFMMKMLHPS